MIGTEQNHGACGIREDTPGPGVALTSSNRFQSSRNRFFSLGLPQRLTLLFLLLLVEWAPLTYVVHKGRGGGSLLQLVIVFCMAFLAFDYARAKNSFHQVSGALRQAPLGWSLLGLHGMALLGFVGLSRLPSGTGGYAIVGLWYAAGVVALGLAVCAFVPPRLALQLVRGSGFTWMYACVVALIANRLLTYTRFWNGVVWNPAVDLSWKPASDLTFRVVTILLRPFLGNMVADPASLTIGTTKFQVHILPWCAGFEGTALMLVFSVAWLWFLRREFRFPHALVLIPAGMLVIWISNAVRIAALVLIAVWGAPKVALGGFHSQAGWIAFNAVALASAVVSRRLAWFAKATPGRSLPAKTGYNPAAAYLVPFLAILAAAMISRAVSSGFEWLYPLRFAAAAIALWCFRSRYAEMDWRFGRLSVIAGAVVFALWLGLDRLAGGPTDSSIATGLAGWPVLARTGWLAVRTAAAVVTVPIAEELAFRGFLIRRLMSADFESLGTRQYTLLAVGISSLAFGLLHGDRWLAGTVAGLIYAAVYLRRGRIGDALIAHATTNALLAVWVLAAGKWYLW